MKRPIVKLPINPQRDLRAEMARRSGGMGKLHWLILVLAMLLVHSISVDSLAATPHSYARQCDIQGGPSCPHTPPDPSPWKYYVGVGFGAIAPTFSSQEDALDWTLAFYRGPGFDDCSVSYTGSTEGPIPGFGDIPLYWYGQLIQDSWTLNFSVVRYNSNNCIQTISATSTLLGQRSFSCPANTSFFYQASPVLGPYCTYPGSPIQQPPDMPKQMGCACGGSGGASNSGGGDSGTSRTLGGPNPVDASNGNEFLAEVDYTGTGNNRLKFVRSYNSLAAYARIVAAVSPGAVYPEITGVAWAATYFQSLSFVVVADSANTYSAIYAFRPDGRMLIFKEYQGVYTPEGDVADSLAKTDAGLWQYQTADDTVETYSADGRLLSISARGQAPVTVNYRPGAVAGDLPLSVSDAFGHALQFSYTTDPSAGTRLGSITDPSGQTVQYGYGGYGNGANLTLVTYQDGSTRQYAYGTYTYSSLTGITDEANVQYVTFSYNSFGDHVLSTQLAGGVGSYSFSYDSGSVAVKDPLGTTRTYNQQLKWGVYRTAGLTTPCPGCNEDAARVFDDNGNITQRTDFNGHQTVYTYDITTNQEISRTEAYGTANARTISTQWNPSYSVPTQITEPNRTTSFSYDENGNLLTSTVTDTSVTPNVSRTWAYTYDTYGRKLTADGPRTDVSDVTTYTYYTCTTGFECGQLHTVTDAAGNVTTYNGYDAHGQPLSITDPNGVLTALVYDARMRLISRTTAGETTAFAYYPTGLLQAVTLPDGSSVRYSYDGAHRLTQIADGAGNSMQYALDAMGNRIGESAYDPNNVLSHAVSRVYNTLSELSQTVGASGTAAVTTTYGYDNNGNQTSIAAPLARNTAETYDALNRLNKITDPNTGNTLLTYDANDNLAAVQDPLNLATSYSYSGFGDLLTEVSPSTGTTVNTYDSGGNLATSQDARGVITQYAYDALNRITQAVYGDQTILYSYDAGINGRGRLVGASDSAHSLLWQYDALGRVISKTQSVGNVTRTVGYTFSNGDLINLTTPSGQSITYSYTNHLVSSVTINGTPLLSNASYEPFGPVRGWSWGNGTSESRLHDTDGNPELFTGAESTSYTVDSAFRITATANAANSNLSWAYGYDNLDRITGAAGAANILSWTYDADGNRAIQYGAPAPTYAAASLTLGYNNRGRLSSVTTPSATTAYLYDAMGQRIFKRTGDSATAFVYDEGGRLLGEYDGSGNLIQETVWLGDLPIATLQPSSTGGVNMFYIHADHLNTPKAITRSADNAVVWRWDQDPFGTAMPNQSPAGLGTFVYNLRFPGQYFDAEIGLYYNYFRDFDPATGRYVESDPLGLGGGSYSTYAYANGNPITSDDPTGEAPPGRTGTPTIPTLLPPNIAIPGTPENDAWTQSVWQQVFSHNASPVAAPNSATHASNCPNDDECKQLNKNVQDAKKQVGALGKCLAGMSPAHLEDRYYAWLNLATARSIRDQKCWNGGDDGHQNEQAVAWSKVGECARYLGR
jgi:RHS repeat-associated protein